MKTYKNKNKFKYKTKKYKLKGGDSNQDEFKNALQSNNMNNYNLLFQNNKTINFDCVFNNINLNTYISEKIEEYKNIYKNFNKENSNSFDFNQIDILRFLGEEDNVIIMARQDYMTIPYELNNNYKLIQIGESIESTPSQLPKEAIVLIKVLYALNREILSNNITVNNQVLLDSEKTDEYIKTGQDKYLYTVGVYLKILDNIKDIFTTITNQELFYILLLFLASGENILEFFVVGLLRNMNEPIEEKIGNITFTGSDLKNKNFINYITFYQNAINELFNQQSQLNYDNINIINSINKSFNFNLNVTSDNVVINCYRPYYLSLNLLSPTRDRENLLIGLAINKNIFNLKQNIYESSFKFRWIENTKTKQFLNQSKYQINNLIPWLNNMVPIHSGFKRDVQKMTGVSIPYHLPRNMFLVKGNNLTPTKKGGKTKKKNIKHNIKSRKHRKK